MTKDVQSFSWNDVKEHLIVCNNCRDTVASNGNTLYGNGICDDAAAIQELLFAEKDMALPSSKTYVLLSKPLETGSNTVLTLTPFLSAGIRTCFVTDCSQK